MRAALAEASQAATWGDVPIGAVVLDAAGGIVASAANQRERDGDPLAHAEMLALRRAADALDGHQDAHLSLSAVFSAPQPRKVINERDPGGASWRLDGCTMVVTLEPCAMCAGAIAQARLARLVFGAFDEKAGAVASLFDVLRDPRLPHRPEVVPGVLADESAALLQTFFAARR